MRCLRLSILQLARVERHYAFCFLLSAGNVVFVTTSELFFFFFQVENVSLKFNMVRLPRQHVSSRGKDTPIEHRGKFFASSTYLKLASLQDFTTAEKQRRYYDTT
jgi:hypothetical protein